jgi:hypothetical protein
MRSLLTTITAVVLLSAAANAQPVLPRVYVWAYGCPFAGAKTVTVFTQNAHLFGPTGRRIHVPATVTADNALEFIVTVPPGPMDIDFSVDGENCTSGGGGLVVLPGHDRHVVFSMQPSLFVTDWHARKFFAGTLPGFPVSVSVVASQTSSCPDGSLAAMPATIDNGAYYVGYVHGLHTFLKIRSAGSDTLYIALPDASPVDSDNQYVRRDISLDDLRTLTKHSLNRDQQCIISPSGASTRFDRHS